MELFIGRIIRAEIVNPLLTKVTYVLTDFKPNANKVGIPFEEAENLIATAPFQPFKINFTDKRLKGHDNSIPIGVIESAELAEVDNERVLVAIAWLWREVNNDAVEFIEANKPGTSWEIFYETAESVDGVKWLRNCILSGTCVVKNPSYLDRTRILTVAENMELEEALQKIETLNASIAALNESIAVKDTNLEALQMQVNELQALEVERQRNALKHARSEALSAVGLYLDESVFMALDDAAFDAILSAVKTTASKLEVSEVKKTGTPQFPAETERLNRVTLVAQALKNTK